MWTTGQAAALSGFHPHRLRRYAADRIIVPAGGPPRGTGHHLRWDDENVLAARLLRLLLASRGYGARRNLLASAVDVFALRRPGSVLTVTGSRASLTSAVGLAYPRLPVTVVPLDQPFLVDLLAPAPPGYLLPREAAALRLASASVAADGARWLPVPA